MKKIIITIAGLAITSLTPVFPTDMELQYSYSFDYLSQAQITELQNDPITANVDYTRPFPDSDGDGVGYASVFLDNNGNEVIVELSKPQYEKMGELEGYQFNTKKQQYLNLLETLRNPLKVSAAIAFDVSNEAANSSASSLTYAHTVTGSDTILFVGNTSNGDVTSGVTYNSVALTKIDVQKIGSITGRVYLWYLVAPADGANNVVLTYSSSVYSESVSSSYTGAQQTSPIGATSKGTKTFSNDTLANGTLTTLTDNSWTILSASHQDSGTVTADDGTLRNTIFSILTETIIDSNAPISPAGSSALTANGGNDNLAWIMAEFEVAASAADSRRRVPIFSE